MNDFHEGSGSAPSAFVGSDRFKARNASAFRYTILSILAGCVVHGQGKETPEEVFAKIAATDVTPRLSAGMELPGPAPLPSNLLPWNGGKAEPAMARIDTAEKLKAAIADAREK